MFIKFLLFLGVCGIAAASHCTPAEALTTFDMKMFEGKWYDLNMVVTSSSKSELPDGLRCSSQSFTWGYKKFKTTADMYIGEEHKIYPLTLSVPDVTLAHMTSNIMDVNVVCTDYTTWAVTHYCINQEDKSLDLVILMGRSREAYDKITSSKDVKDCLQKLGTSTPQGWKIDHDNCKN